MTREEALIKAKELLAEAKETNEPKVAWELVDLIHDMKLLEK